MYIFIWKKKRRLFICGSYTNVSDHAVFPASTNKKQKNQIITKIKEIV